MQTAAIRNFQLFVTWLSWLNESFHFLNLWIIMPSNTKDKALDFGHVNPVITSVIYAIVEPLFSWLLLRIPIRPWIYLWALSPGHILWSSSSLFALRALNSKAEESARTSISDFKHAQDSDPGKSSGRRSNGFHVVLACLPALFSAAMVNATLLVFSQSLQTPSLYEGDSTVQHIGISAVLIHLICRFIDYYMFKEMQRDPFGSQQWSNKFSTMVPFLLLFIVRACTRNLLGLEPLLAFQKLQPSDAERLFGPGRYQWMDEGIRKFSAPAPWFYVLTPLSLLLSFAGQYLMHRAFKE